MMKRLLDACGDNDHEDVAKVLRSALQPSVHELYDVSLGIAVVEC